MLLVRLPDNHTAEVISAGVAEAMSPSLAGSRRTLTGDQGIRAKKWLGHARLGADLGTSIYFCEAHSPWQRPTSKNMKGLRRDYFPTGEDPATHSADRLRAVQNELVNRPSKCLKRETPTTVFACPLPYPSSVKVSPFA